MKSVSHIILATLLSAGVAVAQEEVNFDSNDTNGDGYLSTTEWAEIDGITAEFDSLDVNRDGMLDRNEVSAGLQNQAQGAMQQNAAAQGTQAQSVDMQQTGSEQSSGALESNPQGTQSQSVEMQQTSSQSSDAMQSNPQGTQSQSIDMQDSGDMEATTIPVGEEGEADSGEWVDDEYTRFERSSYEGEEGASRFREDFDRRDANADGYLDEMEATDKDWIDINLFEKSDANDDGLIDIGEAEDGFMEWGDDEATDEDPVVGDERE